MKVKFLVPMAGRDVLYEPEKEYEVKKDFGLRLIKKSLAVEVKEEKKTPAKKTTPKKKK